MTCICKIMLGVYQPFSYLKAVYWQSFKLKMKLLEMMARLPRKD